MNQAIKQQAKELGVPFDLLQETYRELRAYERQSREWDWSIRRRVWEMYSYSVESNEFWRHGMHVRFARAFGEGDRTLIPRWDEAAQEMALEFPELSIDGDPAERLFEIIAQRYEPLPAADLIWKQALDLSIERVAECSVDAEPVPF